jgi:hypothetical protein
MASQEEVNLLLQDIREAEKQGLATLDRTDTIAQLTQLSSEQVSALAAKVSAVNKSHKEHPGYADVDPSEIRSTSYGVIPALLSDNALHCYKEGYLKPEQLEGLGGDQIEILTRPDVAECYKAGYVKSQDLIDNFQTLNAEMDTTLREKIALGPRAHSNKALQEKQREEGRDVNTIGRKLETLKSSILEMSRPESRERHIETKHKTSKALEQSANSAAHSMRSALDNKSTSPSPTPIGPSPTPVGKLHNAQGPGRG